MFKICSTGLDNDVKVHFAIDKEIAETVFKDLEQRFGNMVMEETEGNEYCWDPGGMLWTGDCVLSFSLKETINCREQHYDYFKRMVDKCVQRGEETKYVKLHAHWSCYCMSVESFEKLKTMFSETLSERAERALKSLEAKMTSLYKSGALVTKGE